MKLQNLSVSSVHYVVMRGIEEEREEGEKSQGRQVEEGRKGRKTHPSRLHSPISFCLQQLSLKSLTGLNSAKSGRIAYHLSFKFSKHFADSASYSYRA
jgi:hypothetical protein